VWQARKQRGNPLRGRPQEEQMPHGFTLEVVCHSADEA
jgi:hypothetical protein